MSNAQPNRLMPYLLLALSGMVATWIDRCAGLRRAALLAVLAAGAVCTLPAPFVRPNFWDAVYPNEPFFRSGAYRNVIRQGETVLFLPFRSDSGNEMFWQVETGGYFRMTNGYGDFVPAWLAYWPAVQMLQADSPAFDFPQQFAMFTRANGVSRLIVSAPLLPVWNAALQASHWLPQTFGDITVFSPSPGTQADAPDVSLAQARYSFAAAHFAALRAAATCMLGKQAAALGPASAIAAHCLSPDIDPASTDPNGNWDRIGGWLGYYGNGVGLGVMTDAATARRLVTATGANAENIYFPYPKKFQPDVPSSAAGQFLEIFPADSFKNPQ